MTPEAERAHATLREHFPLAFERHRIELLPELLEIPAGSSAGEEAVFGVVRVITWDLEGSIRDVVEQQLWLLPHPVLAADGERLRACVEAHGEVLGELFAARRPDDEALMPYDLLFFSEVLTLRRAASREDFARALRAKRRLGRWLPASG